MIRYLRCAQVIALCSLYFLYVKAAARAEGMPPDLNLHHTITRPATGHEDNGATDTPDTFAAQAQQDSRQLAIMRSPPIIVAIIFLLCLFVGLMTYSVWRMVRGIMREKERRLDNQRKPLLRNDQLMVTVTDYDREQA